MTTLTDMRDTCIFLTMLMTWFLMFTDSGHCHSIDDAKRLLADKKLGYEKNFRPVVNQSTAVEIYIGFELLSIQEFDEVKEQLTVAAFITAFWIDEFMTWQPNEYGGLGELVIASENVWTPNLVLVNNVEKLEKIGDPWQVIRFFPNGLAYYYPGDVFSASCRADITYYPWDRHKCSFTFSPWALPNTEIFIISLEDKVQTTFFSENGAWNLYNSSTEHISVGSIIDFNLHLERKPGFVVINVIIPVIFMAFLNTMIFAIPVESGERISYSITVLLALAVFLTVVGDNLPKTSSPMSFFGYYLLVVLIVSIAITLATILNVRLYYKDEDDPVPNWIDCVSRCFQCKCRSKRKHSTGKYKTESRKDKNKHRYANHIADVTSYIDFTNMTNDSYYDISRELIHRPVINGRVPYKISSLTNTVDSNSIFEVQKPKHTVYHSTVSWKDVSSALDKIFFVLSFLIIVIATIIFIVYISDSNKN